MWVCGGWGQVCACKGQLQMPSSIAPHPHYLSLWIKVSLWLELAALLDWLAGEPSGSASSAPASPWLELQAYVAMPSLMCMLHPLSHLPSPGTFRSFCTQVYGTTEDSTPWACFSKLAVQAPPLWALLTCKFPQTQEIQVWTSAIASLQNGKREFSNHISDKRLKIWIHKEL